MQEKYMNDMKLFFQKDIKKPLNPNGLHLFKEDWNRVASHRDRMERKHANLPPGVRKMELESLANTLSYILSKFEIVENDE